jgi:hypothetical protein
MIDCRLRRFIVLAIALLPLCWLAMQVVHEAGHVIAAWMTGGRVMAVVLHPLAISRTDVSPNPRPLIVVWGGPVIGSLLPLGWWALTSVRRSSSAYLWRFFAGFCLVANGAYLGSGLIDPIGDANDILRHGGDVWQLAAFAIVAVIAGFALWHRQGPHFGLGPEGKAVPLRHVTLTWAGLIVAAVGEIVWTYLTGFE